MATGGEPRIGVAFLARGLHPEWEHAFRRFVRSYRRFPAGIPHRLYVIFKGYRDPEHLARAVEHFIALPHLAVHTHDAGFDIGCYQRMAREMKEEFVCFLNTKSEVLSANWLRKLAQHAFQSQVGLVGNTGSYESPHHLIPEVPPFPDPHIRTNAFLIQRERFLRIVEGLEIRSKSDGWMFECGPESLTRQVLRAGLKAFVVGRDGRAHEIAQWPESRTYCTRGAAPLIGDDTYRKYRAADRLGKRQIETIMWGPAEEESRIRAKYRNPPAMNLPDPAQGVMARAIRSVQHLARPALFFAKGVTRRVLGDKCYQHFKRSRGTGGRRAESIA